MNEVLTEKFKYGVMNSPLLPEMEIPRGASVDSLGWTTKGGAIELTPGRVLLGNNETTAGGFVKGHHFGYTATGVAVEFRKINTRIQYYNTSTLLWVDTVTGLNAAAEYTFSNYQSLAGSFVYATGADGLYKIPASSPGSYVNAYDQAKNFKAKSIIVQNRMVMWGTPTDSTGLYISYIDKASYSTNTNETVGSGNGSTKTFTGTLAFHSVALPLTAFAAQFYGQIATAKTISLITAQNPGYLTATAHGLAAGDWIYITGVSGMTQINGKIMQVATVIDSNNIQLTLDTTAYSAYTSGGSLWKLEEFKDNYDGTLTGTNGGTGTLNYASGAYSITFNTAPVTGTNNILVTYQVENSNNNGITDFTYSVPRTAGQGAVFRQDEGGDAIQFVQYQDGSFYSMKQRMAYQLTLTSDDTKATNIPYRYNLGMPYWRASVATSLGIVFMDTGNPDSPKLTRLEKNLTGDALVPKVLGDQFDLSKYVWDQCAMQTWGQYIVFNGRTKNSLVNNRLFLFNVTLNSMDVYPFGTKTLVKDAGYLYAGDSFSDNVYQLFIGPDDDGLTVENYWDSNLDYLGSRELKKVRRLRVEGLIGDGQNIDVYGVFDRLTPILLGTIRSDGSYVDRANPYLYGMSYVGETVVGSGGDTTTAYEFQREIKVQRQVGKFQIRKLRFVARGYGYAAIKSFADFDITLHGNRIPTRFRTSDSV